jgi:hypothetical protein
LPSSIPGIGDLPPLADQVPMLNRKLERRKRVLSASGRAAIAKTARKRWAIFRKEAKKVAR